MGIIRVCSLMLFILVSETKSDGVKFARNLRVSIGNYPNAMINSKTGITNHGQCAKLCKNEPCLSFVYDLNENRCDTYSQRFTEDAGADVSMTTMYFNKIEECTFEIPCISLALDSTSDNPFVLLTGPTPSYYTGCAADHTTGFGSYYYLESSEPVQPGENSRLISTAAIEAGIQVCVQLWYNMYGYSMGSLSVRTKDLGGVFTNSFLVADGPQIADWLRAVQVIPAQPGNFWIVIEALRGSNTKSDICIDDVSIFRC